MQKGKVTEVHVFPEKGGVLFLENPFGKGPVTVEGADIPADVSQEDVIRINTEKGKEIVLRAPAG